MFNSLRPWINVPITIKPFIRRDGVGSPIYKDEWIETKAYPKADAVSIANNVGIEIKSGVQLYVEGSTVVKEQDAIIFEENERVVRAVTAYYRDGVQDIKVVYL